MIQRFHVLTLPQFKRLGASLGKFYHQRAGVIGLIGPLGAGKTTFAKSFAQSLGIKQVKSPTFTIVSSFQLNRRQFHHIDFYRLAKSQDLQPLGILPLLSEARGLVLIEWVDKFPKLQRYCDLIIKISLSNKPNRRNVTIYQN